MATYPNSIFQWNNRQDLVNIVFANDPNSLAAEVQSIEATVGVIPQYEQNPPTGSTVQYPTLSTRVSAANNNSLLPYCELSNAKGLFINQGQQFFNSYTQQTDPYRIWNGQDATIPCNGWWFITADQKWNQQGNNFRGGNVLFMYLNGTWIDAEIWQWDNFFADQTYHYASNVFNANGYTRVHWQGLLHQNDRIQILSANSTFCPGIQITNMNFKLSCLRTITGTFTSG